jgi:hypothetical protein
MQNNDNTNHVFWLVVGCLVFSFAYISLITFVPIPKESQRFADTSLGFIQGVVIAGCIGYYLGGNPALKRQTTAPPGTTNAEITASITSEPAKQDEQVSPADTSNVVVTGFKTESKNEIHNFFMPIMF